MRVVSGNGIPVNGSAHLYLTATVRLECKICNQRPLVPVPQNPRAENMGSTLSSRR